MRCSECGHRWRVSARRLNDGVGVICPNCDAPRKLIVRTKRGNGAR